MKFTIDLVVFTSGACRLQTPPMPTSARGEETARSGTQSIERAIAVLECLRLSDRSLALSEIAREAGLTVSTTHRLLRASRQGWLRRTGPLHRALPARHRDRRARPASDRELRLPTRTTDPRGAVGTLGGIGESAVRRGAEVVVIDRVMGPAPLAIRSPDRSGTRRLRLRHGQGTSRLLDRPRSTLKSPQIPSLEQFTERTITDRDALAAELTATAARGYAVNIEERYDGVSGVAAPVLSASGRADSPLVCKALHPTHTNTTRRARTRRPECRH